VSKRRTNGLVIIMILTLAVVLAMASGCSKKNDAALRFEMERKLNQADRLQEQLKVKSSELSEADLKTVIDAYSAITKMVAPAKNNSEVQNASEDKKQAWALASLATTRIGGIYLEKKLYDKAYNCFAQVNNDPSTSAIQKNAVTNYMALAQEQLGNFAKAAELYDSLATGYLPLIVPANPNLDALEAPLKSAEMWRKAGEKDKYLIGLANAKVYFNALITKYKGTLTGSAAVGKLAASLIQQGDYAQAIEILGTVRDDSSGHVSPSVMLMIADIYMSKLNDYSSAEKTYREFVNTYPDKPDIGKASLGLGLSLFQQGKFLESRKQVEGIEKLPKVTQQTVAQAFYLTALSYEKEDKWELAKGQFDIIQTSFPGANESFESVLHVADYYRNKGQTDLAQKAFDEAVGYINKYISQNTDKPDVSAIAIGYLVRAYTENKQLDKAIEQLVILHDHYLRYPEGKFAPIRLADMYENSLHDLLRAISWLKVFVSENPDANDLNQLQMHIQNLEQKAGVSH
jgi:tetratricopeptide (TPR) repeat protein